MHHDFKNYEKKLLSDLMMNVHHLIRFVSKLKNLSIFWIISPWTFDQCWKTL